MNTYAKILVTTLPLVFFFLFATVGTTYYFARMALNDLAETWLGTRLSEAMRIAAAQTDILKVYGLEDIPASIAKAKIDAGSAMSAIEVGKLGYIFAVDAQGAIALHPDRALIGSDVSKQAWFREMKQGQGRFVYITQAGRNLARHDYFEPWQWFIVATDPEAEVYGVADRMRPYVIWLGIVCSIVLATALMLLARRLTQPLRSLTDGADRIGKGDLETRISIRSRDEFGHLAEVFNRMAAHLQETLTTLQRREEHFRAIIENASDIVAILDADGVFLYASPSIERILGYGPQNLIGKNALEFLHPADRRNIAEYFKQPVESVIPATPTEFRFRHNSGSWCTLEGTSENLLDHPAVKGFVINVRDISKRKQAEAGLQNSHQELERRVQDRTVQLKATNKELKDFAYVVSHDLKAPLRAISHLTHWISKDYSEVLDQKGKDMMGLVIKRVQRMDGLIDGVLRYSRIGVVSEEEERLDLNLIVRVVIDNLAPPDNIKITIENKLPIVLSDSVRMGQVFENIVGNAVKFMDKREGIVRVGCRDAGTHWQFSVSDNGPGIARQYQDKIFQIFQTLTPRDEHESTGIGLTLVKKIIELYGGSIWVVSEVGNGSNFFFTLPKERKRRFGQKGSMRDKTFFLRSEPAAGVPPS
jgi:PAS domain S-box-containing protein